MGRLIEFDDDELEMTMEVIREYRAEVARGNIIPGGGTQDEVSEELISTARLIEKLERAAH